MKTLRFALPLIALAGSAAAHPTSAPHLHSGESWTWVLAIVLAVAVAVVGLRNRF